MADDPKKNLALLILGKRGKGAPPSPASELGADVKHEDESSPDMGAASAMDDFIAAVASKDTKAALEAFTSLKELC